MRHRTTGPDGKRNQVRRRFTTSKEAGEHLDSFQEQLRKEQAAVSADGPQTTVDEAVTRWLAAQRINPTTEQAYTAALAPVVERFGDRAVRTVTDEEIQHLIKDLRAGTCAPRASKASCARSGCGRPSVTTPPHGIRTW
ncbi:hypothetical protein [Gordonia iterans]